MLQLYSIKMGCLRHHSELIIGKNKRNGSRTIVLKLSNKLIDKDKVTIEYINRLWKSG